MAGVPNWGRKETTGCGTEQNRMDVDADVPTWPVFLIGEGGNRTKSE